MKNVVLTDFKIKSNWDFIEGLNENCDYKWENINFINNGKTNTVIKKIKKVVNYIKFSFKIFCNREKYKNIIAWQQYYGLFFAIFCNLFKVKKCNQLLIMTFIYKHKNGVLGKIKHFIINKCVSSQYVDNIIVFSRNEVKYYSDIFPQAKNKFIFLKLGVEDITLGIKNSNENKILFSSGNSNRDYIWLIDAFNKINYKLEIACYDAPESNNKNVTIKRNVFGDDYYRAMAKSHIVIVSLNDPNISSGQLVFIHAMQFGKPIICTSSNAIDDYIKDGLNGKIIEKNSEKLEEAIKDIEKNYEFYSKNSREYYENNFTLKKMAESIINIVSKEVNQ